MQEPEEVTLCQDCPEEPVTPPTSQELLKWHVKTVIEKYEGDFSDAAEIPTGLKPYSTIEIDGNTLVNNGASILCDAIMGTAITAFSNANARIGIGDSTTAVANTQTDLQAATNKLRKAMDATYPQKSGAAPWSLSFRSTFASADANYVWNEWAIFNAASGATSMFNRKVESMGTKSSGTSWVITVTITPTAP